MSPVPPSPGDGAEPIQLSAVLFPQLVVLTFLLPCEALESGAS